MEGAGAGDVGVGEAVEPVFAEFVAGGYVGIDGVGMCGGRDGGVESGVEERDVGCLGAFFEHCCDDVERRGAVQWCQL